MVKEVDGGAMRTTVRPLPSSKGGRTIVCPTPSNAPYAEEMVRPNVVAYATSAEMNARKRAAKDGHGPCLREGPLSVLDEVVASFDVIQRLAPLLHVI